MSRKHYFLLVRCLCAMLCCITFLLTSITTKAANQNTYFSSGLVSGSNLLVNNDWTSYTFPMRVNTVSSGNTFDSSHFTMNFNISSSVKIDSNAIYALYLPTSVSFSSSSLSKINHVFYFGDDDSIIFNSTNSTAQFYEVPLYFVSGSELLTNKANYFSFQARFWCSYNGQVTASNPSNVSISVAPQLWLVNLSNYRGGTSQSFDTGTHQALQQIKNTLDIKLNQVNETQQDILETEQDTNSKITSFFNGFWDNLLHIFVPEDGFFSQWFNSLNTFMSQKLGFLWSPFDFILSFLNGIYNSSGGHAQIVFPELAWIDGTVIIPRTVFSFDNIGGQSFTDLRDMIYFATDVILLGSVVNQFYQKVKLVFEGGSD